MGRKSSKRSSALGSSVPWVPWKTTKCMNARDLSRDDDYLSHLFIEKISGIGATPLLVHRMDPERALPKTDTQAVYNIVQLLVRARPSGPLAIKQGVNSLFQIHSVLYFIKDYDQRQINAFATHASRYLELYLPTGSIEIAQTSRYSRITSKNELCILATRPMPVGFLIAELKGSMAELTEEEDRELRNPRGGIDGGRRDFSVIHSKQLKKNHLFLGPARFVNHDCDNNCELFRDGRYITFRTIKPIAMGQELTAHYGEGYFGKNNRHCLCETCERRGKGGYSPQVEDNGRSSSHDNGDSDSANDSDSDSSSITSADSGEKEEVNLNERRTRRGVYRIIQDESEESEEDDEEEESMIDLLYPARKGPLSALPIPERQSTERETVMIRYSNPSLPKRRGRPPKEPPVQASVPAAEKASFKSVITTRGQKAREASMSSSISQGRSPSALPQNIVVLSHLGRMADPNIISITYTRPKARGRPRKYPLPEGSTLFQVKKEENPVEKVPQARSRPPIASKAASAKAAVATEKGVSQRNSVPSGPLCVTCLNPLPAEEIEEQTSTSAKGKGKGKGKAKAVEKECQRCARHLAIWGAPWPQRIATPGSRNSSTRENTPSDFTNNITQASLSAVDMKLSAARLAQLRRVKEMEREAGVGSSPATGPLAKLKRKRKDLELESESTDVHPRALKRQRPVQTVNVRGAKVKVENADEVSLHDTVKKRAVVESGLAPPTFNSRKRGRPSAADEEVDTSSGGLQVDDDGDDRRDKTFWPALPPLPPVGDGIKRTGLLNLRPNPNHVSRWRVSTLRATHSSDSTPTLIDDDTDETTSDEHPTTPENNDGLGETPEVMEDVERQSFDSSDVRDLPPTSDEDEEVDEDNDASARKMTVSTLKGLGLISKPNPLALSKRIWAPPTLIADPDCEDMNAMSSLEQAKPKKRRKDPEISDQWTTGSSRPSSPIDRTSLSDLSIHAFESKVKKGMFDDFDASSGEEDVIVPGPSNSRLYLLQNKAFSTPDYTQTSLQASPASDTASTATTAQRSPPSVSLTSSPSLAKILNQPMLTLGPLHSEFLPPSPVPVPSPSFVNAGWDAGSESDSSV